MNIKEMLDFEQLAAVGLKDDNDIEEHLESLGEYLTSKAEEGQKIITRKISEETFVRVAREVKRCIMASMLSNDTGALLAMADIADELDAYTHTMFLSLLAILAEEEVI